MLTAFLALICLLRAGDPLPKRVVLDVPRVRQELNFCGIASAAMVIEFYRGPIDQVVLGHLTGDSTIKARGVSMGEISKSLALFGIRSQMVNLALQREKQADGTIRWVGTTPEQKAAGLKEELVAKHPVLMFRPESGGEYHAIVITGVDDDKRLVYYNDPNEPERPQTVDYDVFAKDWSFLQNGATMSCALLTRFDLTLEKADPDHSQPTRVDVSGATWAVLLDDIGRANRRYLTGKFWSEPPYPAGFMLVPRDFTREDVRKDSRAARKQAREVTEGLFANLLASGRPFLACGGNGRRGGYRLVVGCDPQAHLIWYYQGRQRWPAAESTETFADWWAYQPDRTSTLQIFLMEPLKKTEK